MEALFNLPQERVISEFMCAKKRRRGGQLLYHGRLYVSQNYVCWRAKTITGATKDVVLHLGDLVHMSKSRHAMINPAIRIVARHKRYLFTSFFPFTMRDHACTIIAGQWALYDAAAVIQRKFRAHLSATGRTSKAKRFPFKILYKPAAILDEATGVARMSSQNDSVTDFGGDNDSSSGGGGGGQSAAEVADVADYDILSDLQNGVQGLDELPFKHIIKTFEVPTTVKQAYSILFSDSSPFTETVHLANQVRTSLTIATGPPHAARTLTAARHSRLSARPPRNRALFACPSFVTAGGDQSDDRQVAAERLGGRAKRQAGNACRLHHRRWSLARDHLRPEDRQPVVADQAGPRLLVPADWLALFGRARVPDALDDQGRALRRVLGDSEEVDCPPSRCALPSPHSPKARTRLSPAASTPALRTHS